MGLMTFTRMRRRLAEPTKQAPAPEAPATGDGYRVEKTGTWYALIGPDGEKVGTSQRSEADAWALLEDR